MKGTLARFSPSHKYPLDDRLVVKTRSDRDALPEWRLYEGLVCVTLDNGHLNLYQNGQWRDLNAEFPSADSVQLPSIPANKLNVLGSLQSNDLANGMPVKEALSKILVKPSDPKVTLFYHPSSLDKSNKRCSVVIDISNVTDYCRGSLAYSNFTDPFPVTNNIHEGIQVTGLTQMTRHNFWIEFCGIRSEVNVDLDYIYGMCDSKDSPSSAIRWKPFKLNSYTRINYHVGNCIFIMNAVYPKIKILTDSGLDLKSSLKEVNFDKSGFGKWSDEALSRKFYLETPISKDINLTIQYVR